MSYHVKNGQGEEKIVENLVLDLSWEENQRKTVSQKADAANDQNEDTLDPPAKPVNLFLTIWVTLK